MDHNNKNNDDVTKDSHSVIDKPTPEQIAATEINIIEDESTRLLYYDRRVSRYEVKVLVDSRSMENYISSETT